METLRSLALIVSVLRRKPEDVVNSQILQLGKMIAKATRLRGATARTGNIVPSRRQIDSRHARARINVNDSAPRQY